ncbi:MAG: DUF4304 domain-containing protein [bacterium]
MESIYFQKVISDFLKKKGFSKKGSSFLKETNDILLVIGVQKSSYSEGFYINVGYILQELNKEHKKQKYMDGDVRARFSYEKEGKTTDYFEPENITEKELENILNNNIMELIEPILSVDNLKTLINKKPVMLYQITLQAKQILGFS